MSGSGRAGWRRVLGALCVGHVAAACSFSTFDMVAMAVFDPSVPTTEPLRLATEFAGIAFGLPLMVLIAMLPFSVLTAPFAIIAAFRFRAGAGTALAVGAAIGAAWVLAFDRMTETQAMTWSRAGLPGDPRTLALIVVDGSVAGMAYAWVVWSRCIRPYVDRSGLLRAVQVSP